MNTIFKALFLSIFLLFDLNGSSFVVENIAKATYSVKGEKYSSYSNLVKTVISKREQDDNITIEFFKYSSNSDKYISIDQTDYAVSFDANGKFNKMTPLILSDGTKIDFNKKFPVIKCLVYSSNDPIIIAVKDHTKKGTLSIKVSTSKKDKEIIKLKESHKNSGVFLGYIKTTTKESENRSCDGKLYVYEGAKITVSLIKQKDKKRSYISQTSKSIMVIDSSIEAKSVSNKRIWLKNTPVKKSASMGDKIIFRVDITNSSLKLEDIDLIVELPKTVNIVSDIREFEYLDNNKVLCHIDSLKENEKLSFEYIVDTKIYNKNSLKVSAWMQKGTQIISNRTLSKVQIKNSLYLNKVFIFGRVVDEDAKAVQNVKLYLENGIYTITDKHGNFHFEGLDIGTHVIQVDTDSLNSKYSLKNLSKFIEFHTEGIKYVDFVLKRNTTPKKDIVKKYNYKKMVKKSPGMPEFTVADIKKSKNSLQWLWPPKKYNPSVPSIKIALLHQKSDKLELFINGEKISMLNYEGQIKSGTKVISKYRGVDILDGDNELIAKLTSKDGKVKKVLKRNVHFSTAPVSVNIVEKYSHLVADGKSEPVIAVKFYDEGGYPIREDVQGTFSVEAPYRAYIDKADLKKNPLVNLDKNSKFIVYAQGIAFIRLEPTTKAGEVKLHFNFKDSDEIVRAWLKPSVRDWVMVGFAEGSIGYKEIEKSIDLVSKNEFYKNGKVSFFAKGRVKGDILLSIAYDSGKSKDLSLFEKVDPNEFYTIYADDSEQFYEAQSKKKLYLKIEKDKFYALFGDIQTSLTVSELSKYDRVFNGIKSQYNGNNFSYSAFISKSKTLFVKDEIRADGTSGVYFLKNKNIIEHSEKVTIQTRDKYRDTVVLSSKPLSAYIDYSIDYDKGSLYFKNPVFSQDEDFNPVYIVVDYEVEGDDKQKYTYGGRVAVSTKDKAYELGVSYINEDQAIVGKNLVGVDAKLKINDTIQIKSEYARTKEKTTQVDGEAYLAEIIYRKSKYNLRAYYRQQNGLFGLKQQNSNLKNTKKYGLEAVVNYWQRVSLKLAGYRDESLLENSYKDVGEFFANYKTNTLTAQLGLRMDSNKDDDNIELISGISKLYFDKRVKLSIRNEKVLKGEGELFPNKTRYEASYAITSNVSVFSLYETSKSITKKQKSFKAGINTKLWKGATFNTDISKEFKNDSSRLFANYAMKQNYQATKNLQLSAGIDTKRVITDTSEYNDEYKAYYIGLNYHKNNWTVNVKGEYRDSNQDDKINFDLGIYNEINESLGLAFGIRTNNTFGLKSDKKNVLSYLSFAYRPKAQWMFLNKFNVLYSMDGSLSTMKIVNNSLAYLNLFNKFNISMQYGLKYTDKDTMKSSYRSVVDLFGIDLDYDLTKKISLGLHTSLLHSYDSWNLKYSLGSNISYKLFDNSYIKLGYNTEGFYEDDIKSKNSNTQGMYIDYKMKFNQNSVKDIINFFPL